MNGGKKPWLVALSFAAAGCASTPNTVEVRPIADPGSKMRAGSDSLADAKGQLALGNVGLALEGFRKASRNEPNNAEAWHTIGVYYQDNVFRNKTLPSKQAMEYTAKGVEAENKALAINPEYYEALTYKNILLRQQALYEKSPVRQKELLAEAEVLLAKALEIRKKQNVGAAAATPDPAAAKKAGS